MRVLLCGVKLCLTIKLIISVYPLMIGTYLMKKNGTP